MLVLLKKKKNAFILHFSTILCILAFSCQFILKVLLLLSSHWVLSNSWQTHGLQHTRLICPPLYPEIYSDSHPLSQWYYLTISFSSAPFYFCLQSFPAPGTFLMNQLFASGSQSIGASASASVLSMNIQGWFSLGLIGLVSLLKGLPKVFYRTTVQKHEFFGAQPSLGFLGGSDGKESTWKAEDLGSIPGLGRSPGGEHGNPFQNSCLVNPHGQRNLADYSSWGHNELDMTEWLSTAQPSFWSSSQIHIWLLDHQFSSVAESCPTLWDTMSHTTPGSLSINNSWSLPKLMSIKSVMQCSHLILCHPLLLLPPIPLSIRVFTMSQLFTWDGQSIGV